MTEAERKALWINPMKEGVTQEPITPTFRQAVLRAVREHLGLKEPLATQFAAVIIRGVGVQLGGERVYVPQADAANAEQLAKRNDEIRRRYDGTNLDQLCREFRLGWRMIYNIVGHGRRGQQ